MLDMDSTLIEQEVIDLLSSYSEKADQIAQITKRAMAGEIDFQEALLTRVELLSGVSESVIEKVRNQISLTKGAETLIQELHKIGHKVG
ncbi:MAG: phosphoserine phosphatase, partial [bacterium]